MKELQGNGGVEVSIVLTRERRTPGGSPHLNVCRRKPQEPAMELAAPQPADEWPVRSEEKVELTDNRSATIVFLLGEE